MIVKSSETTKKVGHEIPKVEVRPHPREGHRPDLADLPRAKKARGRFRAGTGDPGSMGRILVRGEPGHDIIPELYPLPGEPSSTSPARVPFIPPTWTRS